VLEYDNVMSKQRNYVYDMRKKILLGTNEEVKEILDTAVEIDEKLSGVIEKKIEEIGEENFYDAARKLVLQIIDMLWMEHLEAMDYMRSSVNLRAYGQRDPLVEYKKEGSRMFKDMQESVKFHIVELLPNIGAGAFAREEQKVKEMKEDINFVGGSSENKQNQNTQPVSSAPKNEDGTKIGRNDPCPCGAVNSATGEVYKYKKCGLINAPYHKG